MKDKIPVRLYKTKDGYYNIRLFEGSGDLEQTVQIVSEAGTCADAKSEALRLLLGTALEVMQMVAQDAFGEQP